MPREGATRRATCLRASARFHPASSGRAHQLRRRQPMAVAPTRASLPAMSPSREVLAMPRRSNIAQRKLDGTSRKWDKSLMGGPHVARVRAAALGQALLRQRPGVMNQCSLKHNRSEHGGKGTRRLGERTRGKGAQVRRGVGAPLGGPSELRARLTHVSCAESASARWSERQPRAPEAAAGQRRQQRLPSRVQRNPPLLPSRQRGRRA